MSTRRSVSLNKVAIATAAMALVNAPAIAQVSQYPQSSNYAGNSASRSKIPDYRGPECKAMQKPIELPDIPQYTSRAYYLGGYQYPADTHSKTQIFQVKYALHEEKDRVLDWYRDALMSYAWKVSQSKQNNDELIAVKGKNCCHVLVVPAKQKDHWFASVVSLNYKMGM